jgi:hypothetical protein
MIPENPLPLDPLATGLVAEVFRKEVAVANTVLETIEVNRGLETTYTTVGGLEFRGVVGEIGLFATITDAGTSGLTVGDVFLLAHAHIGRINLTVYDRLAIKFPIDYRVEVYDGDLDITSDADVALFQAAGYNTVTGYVKVHEAVPGGITSLAGMSTLKNIGGVLEVFDCTVLASLTGLDNVFSTVSVSIVNCPALVVASAFPNIASLRSVYINNVVSITGNLLEAWTSGLAVDGGIPSLIDIRSTDVTAGVLAPSLATGLTTDVTLTNCTTVAAAMPPLLPSAAFIGLYSTTIDTLAGICPSLVSATYVEVDTCVVTAGVPTNAFPLLASLSGGVQIADNTGLTTLDGAFPALTTITGGFGVLVENNIGLLSIGATAFPLLANCDGYVSLGNNDQATTMAGAFPSLTTIAADRYIEVQDHALLTTLAGAFPVLTTVGTTFGSGAVIVDSNPSLVDVTGMLGVLGANGGITVTTNVTLSKVGQIDPLFAALQANGMAVGDQSQAGNAP